MINFANGSEPIINPWLFYLADILDGLKLLTVVLAWASILCIVISLIAMAYKLDDDDEDGVSKWLGRIKKMILPTIASIVFAIVMPSKDTLYKMAIAQALTPDNVKMAYDVTGKTAEEVFNADYKIFNSKNIRFGIGQGSYMSEKNRKASQALIAPYLETALKNQDLDFIFYMFTDVVHSTTELMMVGRGAEVLVEKAFQTKVKDGMAILPGVVSRKKQMVPALINAIKLEDLEETD